MALNKDLWMTPARRRLIRRTTDGGHSDNPKGGAVRATTTWIVVAPTQLQGTAANASDAAYFVLTKKYAVVSVTGGSQAARDGLADLLLTCFTVSGLNVTFTTTKNLTGVSLASCVVTLQRQ